jgi:hypothetical protein
MRPLLAPLPLLLCALLLPTPAQAQGKSPIDAVKEWLEGLGKPPPPPPAPKAPPGNTLTLNPLAVQYQRLGVEYERALGRAVSLSLAPQVAYGRAGRDWRLSTAGTLGARFFVFGDAPSGIFFGPEVGVVYERAQTEAAGLRLGWGLGLGAQVGATLVLFERFVVSASVSAQYRTAPDLDAEGPVTLRSDFAAVPRLGLGVAF